MTTVALGGLMVLLAGCSGCSGRLADEAERALKRERYSMEKTDVGSRSTDSARPPVPIAQTVEPGEKAEGRGVAVENESREAPTAAVANLELPAPDSRYSGETGLLLRRKAYIASFNGETLMPNWVAWKLTREETNGPAKRKGVGFEEDGDVPAKYRVTTYDYNQSGFDRGHMCPAGDNKWDAQAMRECFLMTNICPQLHSLNAGDWNDLEMRCRSWARKYGEVYIACGPMVGKGASRKIGKQRKIAVPTAFFKVVLVMGDTPRALGFVFNHVDGHQPLANYVCSVDEVERQTGLDFFPALPDDVEARVEARADYGAW